MASLLALLSQQTPNLQTQKGLILLGLQNDFASPEGKLPVSTESRAAFDRLKRLVPAFRHFGPVIWVRSEFEATREINSDQTSGDAVIAGPTATSGGGRRTSKGSKRKASRDDATSTKRIKATELDDEELFLTRTSTREPCCIPNSWGADYPSDLRALLDESKDIQVVKSYYSAFSSTSLLLTLRSRLITELFVAGCMTNLSVFATAMDAARYGIQITLLEDCLAYRRKERHEEALRQLVEIMGAEVVTSETALEMLRNPPSEDKVKARDDENKYDDEESFDDDDDDDDDDDNDDNNDDADDENGKHKNMATCDYILAADSVEDEDEENEELFDVRSSRPLNRELSLRFMNRLLQPVLAAEPSSATSSQRAKFARIRPSESPPAFGNDRTSGQPRDRYGGRGGEDHVQSDVATSTGHRIVGAHSDQQTVVAPREVPAKDESAKRSPSNKKPWLDLIDSSSTKDNPPLPCSSHPGLAALSAAAGLNQKTVDDFERAMARVRQADDMVKIGNLTSKPLFGEDEEVSSAGSHIFYDLLPPELSDTIFDRLNAEIRWQRMHHQTGEVPRLVCCQGEIGAGGETPLYRHPSDQTLPVQEWTPAVKQVRLVAEDVIGHPLNHVLIQLYRSRHDYISEHSDKTLDIVPGSYIVNISFGALRTMRLRTKRPLPSAATDLSPVSQQASSPLKTAARTTHRVSMPHNSMLTMSLATNAEFLHGICADKRPICELSAAEKAYNGQRISLTFRNIGTFLSSDEEKIWGQGATGKTRADARPVVNGDALESAKLVRAFGKENQMSGVEWGEVYGLGSDVLHLKPI